jgi:hypothetical protein
MYENNISALCTFFANEKYISTNIPVLCTSPKSKTPDSESICELSFSKLEQSGRAAQYL